MAYAPETSFNPALISAVGDSVSQNIGAGLNKGAEDFIQTRKEGKAADALRQAMYGPEDDDGNPKNAAPFGISDEQWDTMGARDKAAAASGWMQSTILQKAMAETQHLQAEDQANDFYTKMGIAMSKQLDDPNDPEGAILKQTLSPTQQALLRAVGQAGPGNRGAATVVAPIVEAMSGKLAAGSNQNAFFNPKDPQVTDLPGLPGWKRVTTGPNNSQLVFGGGSNGDAVTITSPDGENLGYALQTKNGLQPLKTPGEMTDTQRQDLILKHQNAQTQLLADAQKAQAGGYTNILSAIDEQLATHKQAIADLKKGGKGADKPTPSASGAKPSQTDVTYLAAHPELKGMFEQRFGKGSADQYLP